MADRVLGTLAPERSVSGSHRPRPAACTSASCARRCSTGRSPATTAARSCSASRTPTPRATPRSPTPRPARRRCAGSASTGTRAPRSAARTAPTGSPSGSTSTRDVAATGCSRPARPTTATAPTRRSRRAARRPAPRCRGTTATAATSPPSRSRPSEAEGAHLGGAASGCPTARSPSTTWSAARSPSSPSTCPTSRSSRANGDPLYTLVNPVDDALMGITHVLRGEDLLSSTPRQIALYEALEEIGIGTGDARASGTCPTSWARATRSSPSATPRSNLLDYRDRGFLPEGLLNYLALLGWAIAEDRDVFSLAGDGRGLRHPPGQPEPGALRPEEGRGDQRRPPADAQPSTT